jgi:hypothetical protein
MDADAVQDIYYVIVATGVLVAGASVFYANRKRKVALQELAAQHGWSYSPYAAHLARWWTGPPFRSVGRTGVRNALAGVDSCGRPLVVFDYRYYSNQRQHSHTVLALELDAPLPAGTAARPGAPHAPPLRVRVGGCNVLCWSDELLKPEHIVPAIAWLRTRLDSMQPFAGAVAGAGAGVRAEARPPVHRSSSAAGALAELQRTSWPSAVQLRGHVWWLPKPWTVVAIALGVVLLAVAALGTPSGTVDSPSQPRPADQSEVSQVRADLVRACAQHLGTAAADVGRSRVAGHAQQGYQVFLVSADNIPLGNCSAEVSGAGYRMLS